MLSCSFLFQLKVHNKFDMLLFLHTDYNCGLHKQQLTIIIMTHHNIMYYLNMY